MLESKIDDIANKLNVELPSASFNGPRISTSSPKTTRKIQVSAPKVTINNPNTNDGCTYIVNLDNNNINNNTNSPNSPNDDTKFVSTTTTKVTSAKNNEPPVTVTTTTKLNPDGSITTTEQQVDPANSDSDQTHYSEHTEYVNVNNENKTKNIVVDLSLDGVKVTQSDKEAENRQYH